MSHSTQNIKMEEAGGMMSPFRPTKSKTTGLGMRRKEGALNAKREAPRRQSLRLVSPKQAHRTADLKRKLKQMLLVMELAGKEHQCLKCGRVSTEGNSTKLVADHVMTRNEKDADRYENLGVLCTPCNFKKGSVREDYRPEWFKAEMKKLDRKSAGI